MNQIGNYKVVQKLGEGGMGVVYLAEHAVIGRQAAIKLLLPAMSENAEAVTRFFNEARATARIKHPGIVEIFDCGELPNGQAYIVMEFLLGETLAAYTRRYGKLSAEPNLALAIVRQIATALGAAHARGIIHRDLKPDNVFLSSESGEVDVTAVKILDFGIAKLVTAGQVPAVTTTKELLGTPVYISPEQCRGAKDLDHRTDIYALGCIAFELLTGAPVFQARSLAELIASHLYKEPAPLQSLEPRIPAAFTRLVLRMLAKAPEDRPPTMDDIVDAIDLIGVAAALRGSSVLLSSARPLNLALPAPDSKPPAGAPTLPGGGGGRTLATVEAAARGTFSGLVSEARPDARPVGWRRKPWAIGAGVLGIGALVILLFSRPLNRGHRTGPADVAPEASSPTPELAQLPTTVDVDVDVEDRPPGLTVTVDGRPGRVPISLPLGPQNHTLVFQAEGYEPVTRTLDATKSRVLVLGMRRRPTPPASTTSTTGPVGPATPQPDTIPGAKRPGTRRGGKSGKRRHATDLFLDI